MRQRVVLRAGLVAMVALAAGLMASPWGCGSASDTGSALSVPSHTEILAKATEADLQKGNGRGHGNGAPSGPHWGFEIIGHPNNNFEGDNGNGHAIMVPLHTVPGPDEVVCEEDGEQTVFTDDEEPTWETSEPTGAKIHFIGGDDFDIIDRNALDNDGALIMVPTETLDPNYGPEITFDIYIRVLGRPHTCMTLDAYAYDQDQNLWFWAGGVVMRRQGGQSKFVRVNALFDVFFCQISDCDNTTQHLSVFNDVFEDYFWNILNNGVRNVQVRLYPRRP